MKTEIGGARLGSGAKESISTRHYERSTHNLSANWRSSMAAGTLVPFMSELGLPGDNMEIDLYAEVLTLPTIGPLFGSYKVQLDVFKVPIRLYQAALTMNKLNIGNDMEKVKIPQIKIPVNNHPNYVRTFSDNEQVSPSSIMKYLGISGVGNVTGDEERAEREFNAVPYIAYWDIFKNYYANKSEENAYVVHTRDTVQNQITQARLNINGQIVNFFNSETTVEENDIDGMILAFSGQNEPQTNEVFILFNGVITEIGEIFQNWIWNSLNNTLAGTNFIPTGLDQESSFLMNPNLANVTIGLSSGIDLVDFKLDNIDEMREKLLQHPTDGGAYVIDENEIEPYNLPLNKIGENENATYSLQYGQEGLAVKTYQSDLFNNWVSTEWIDGDNGINAITAVQVEDGEFTIDSLNLSSKVYAMLNRIAISGGSYDDWLSAVYDHDRTKMATAPVYLGSLIKELGFEEVISNSETGQNGNVQPLGTLAGKGRLTQKNKGGKIKVKIDEPSYIIGIVSLTPRINYSQGNKWDMNLKTMDDLHKPALDGIGFQDLITEKMSWTTSTLNSNDGSVEMESVGKQPAWIDYMTNIDTVYGNFADENKDMFMILNRRYDKGENGEITDLTTYIDPAKYNNIFSESQLDAQNFWVQIRKEVKARRKMSAKQIPNL